MKYFDWSNKKNEKLKMEREISLEDVLIAISEKKYWILLNIKIKINIQTKKCL